MPTNKQKKIKEVKKVLGYAVVLNRSISSLYRPNDWFGCYTVFSRKDDAKYWLLNKTHGGKIIKVTISPLPQKGNRK